MSLDTVSIFGLGRVGLVMAVCFAKRGYRVNGVDPDVHLLTCIQNKEPPFFEPNLDEYLRSSIERGTFSAGSDPSVAVDADFVFITVGTPGMKRGGSNLTYLKEAAMSIGRILRQVNHSQLIAIKSTVRPGTARNLVKPILEKESGKRMGEHFDLCSNPEFLREGNAIYDAEHPERIVMGSNRPDALNKLESLFRDFHDGHPPPVVRSTFENAELIKYASNAFLATKVSFINCIANLADCVPNADVNVIAQGIGLDSRIGRGYLRAGLGWGGPCFSKDLTELIGFSESTGYNPQLIKTVVKTNTEQWKKAVQYAQAALGSLRGKRIAILGLSFKPLTDDLRGAVSILIIKALLQQGARVVCYDPAARAQARSIFSNMVDYADDIITCLDRSDCCIVVTEWDEFKDLTPETFLKQMRRPVVVDGRRIFDVDEFMRAGVRILPIGTGPKSP
jgi:UDPglucose 6-dehydrogenase